MSTPAKLDLGDLLKTPQERAREEIIGSFLACFLYDLLMVSIFFCIDDTLAELTGQAWVGTMSFWFVFPAMLFARYLRRTVLGR